MSQQINVWKDATESASNAIDDNYSSRTAGTRYSRFNSSNGVIKDSSNAAGSGSTPDVNVATETYQSMMLQRKLNPQNNASNGHSNSDDGSGEYGRNAVAQGLSFSSFVQQARSLEKANGYEQQGHNDGSGVLKDDDPNMSLSSSGKWRSRRAEQLKANPHSKSYSSNPVQPLSNHTSSGSAPATGPNSNELASNINSGSATDPNHNVTPTTYTNSRFTNFVIEEHQHSAANLTHSNVNVNANAVVDHPTNSNMNRSASNPQLTGNASWSDHANTVNGNSGNAVNSGNGSGGHGIGNNEDLIAVQWYYKDPSGQEQGPFDRSQMSQWFSDGYFPRDLPIRGNTDTPFVELQSWFSQGMTAFLDEIPKQWPQTSEPVLVNVYPSSHVDPSQVQSQHQHDPFLSNVPNGHDPGNPGAITHSHSHSHGGTAVNSQSAVTPQDPFSTTNQERTQSQHQQSGHSGNPQWGRHGNHSHGTTPASSEPPHDRQSTNDEVTFHDVTHSFAHSQMQSNNKEEDENGTVKSSHADADSFYEPNNARMASIHPRPPQNNNNNVAGDASHGTNISNPGGDGPNMNPDEAMNYWVASGPQEHGSASATPAGNGMDRNKGFYTDSSTKLNSNHSSVNAAYRYTFDNEAVDVVTGDAVKRESKLTAVSAYDRSLAATPPSAKQSTASNYWQQPPTQNLDARDGRDIVNGALFGNPSDGMYRASSDPNAYHDESAHDRQSLQQSMGDLQRMASDPGQGSKSKNVYDPFGAQDLFANGRRSLVTQQQQHEMSNGALIHDQQHHGHGDGNLNKFTGDSHTHTMQQGASHRKYPNRQPLKHSMSDGMDGVNAMNAKGGGYREENASSLSSSSSTTPSKQRDRKPPIRHKWAHHDPNYSAQFKQMLNVNDRSESHRQSPPLPPNNNEYDRSGTKPPHHNRYGLQHHQPPPPPPSHPQQHGQVPPQHLPQHNQHLPPQHHYGQYEHPEQHRQGSRSMNEASLSIPASIDQNVNHQVPSNSKPKPDAVTVSELFGGGASNGPIAPSAAEGAALSNYPGVEAPEGDVSSSKKQKTRKRRKKKKSTVNSNASQPTAVQQQQVHQPVLPEKINVWGSHLGSSSANSRPFNELQAEDEQRMIQQKRRRAEEVRRKTEEAILAKQKKVSPQPPQSMSAIVNKQQPVNVWAAGGALKAKHKIAAPSKGAKTKPAKPNKVKKGGKQSGVKGAKQTKAMKQSKPNKQVNMSNGATSAWSSRAAVSNGNVHGTNSSKASRNGNQSSGGGNASSSKGGSKKGSGNTTSSGGKSGKQRNVQNQSKATKNGKSSKSRGNSNSKTSNNHHHFGQQNNRNIEAVNKVSPELQHWLRTEIKKLNPDVEANSVAHLLLTLDDDTARTTATHTFGNNSEVSTFIDSFLMHRSHDLQQQKHKGTSKAKVGGRGGHKKKNNKSRR